jgi:hypothetical protein
MTKRLTRAVMVGAMSSALLMGGASVTSVAAAPQTGTTHPSALAPCQPGSHAAKKSNRRCCRVCITRTVCKRWVWKHGHRQCVWWVRTTTCHSQCPCHH